MVNRIVFILVICLFTACAATTRPPVLTATAILLYPTDAKKRGIEGAVVLRYDVTVEGFVKNVVVVSAQPSGIFEQAAQAYVTKWRFRPALLDGVPVPTFDQISTVTFRLAGQDPYAGY